jgi:hypothetical protein
VASTPDEIVDAVLRLPESDRWQIASRILDTLSENVPGVFEEEEAFLEELKRRAQDGSPRIPVSDLWKQAE